MYQSQQLGMHEQASKRIPIMALSLCPVYMKEAELIKALLCWFSVSEFLVVLHAFVSMYIVLHSKNVLVDT